MGAQLNQIDDRGQLARDVEAQMPRPPSLDDETARLLLASIVEVVAIDDGPTLIAAILFGSVARREERALTEPNPSDVDILLIFAQDEPLNYQERVHVFAALGRAEQRHLAAPRDVKAMLATRTLDEWDTEFIASVARDGRLLWSRSQPARLAPALTPVLRRAGVPSQRKKRRQPTSHAELT